MKLNSFLGLESARRPRQLKCLQCYPRVPSLSGRQRIPFLFQKRPPRVIVFWGSGWPSRSPHSLISDNCCSPPVLPVFSRSNHPQKKRGRRLHRDSLLPKRPVSYSTHPLTFLGMSGTGGGGMAWTGSSPSSPVKASLLANLAANSLSAMKLLKEEVKRTRGRHRSGRDSSE